MTAAAARVDAGAQRLRQARAERLPKLVAQEVWMRTDSPAEAFALQLNQERFSFPAFVASDPNQPDPIENAMTRFEVSLPLYTGGELSRRIRQAELAAEAARGGLDWAGDSAAFGAASAWVQLDQAREGVSLLERSLGDRRGTRRTGACLRGSGDARPIRAAARGGREGSGRGPPGRRTRQGSARPVGARLPARRRPRQRGTSSSRSGRRRRSPCDLDAWLAAADHRPDLEAARQQVAAARLEAGAQRAAGRPRVGLVAHYDLDDDTPFGSHGSSSAIMAQASLDLFAGGRHRAAAAAAAADADAAAADVERFAEGVHLEVRQAWEAATTARERLQTAQAALAAAREAERVTSERFRQGVVKTLDVLDAETARRETEMRELVARADAHLALLELALKSGQGPESALAPAAPANHPWAASGAQP